MRACVHWCKCLRGQYLKRSIIHIQQSHFFGSWNKPVGILQSQKQTQTPATGSPTCTHTHSREIVPSTSGCGSFTVGWITSRDVSQAWVMRNWKSRVLLMLSGTFSGQNIITKSVSAILHDSSAAASWLPPLPHPNVTEGPDSSEWLENGRLCLEDILNPQCWL